MKSSTPVIVLFMAILSVFSPILSDDLLASDNGHRRDATYSGAQSSSDSSRSNSIRLGVNKSIIVDLPRAARDVLVSSPRKADAVMRTARRAYIIGMEVGHTNIFFFDDKGRQILSMNLQIEKDLSALLSLYRRLLPAARINVETLNESIILTGSVKTSSMAAQALEIAARFIQDEQKVVNMLAIEGKDQVFLQVTIAEVQRIAAKQLGIDLNTMLGNFVGNVSDGVTFTAQSLSPLQVAGSPLFNSFAKLGYAEPGSNGKNPTSALLRMLEKNDLLKTLAEPTLTAISGETASFLAGGEFPVPVAQEDNKVSVEYKPFGVSLGFTPVVLSGGRISLKVKTEVSQTTSEGSFSIGGASASTNLSVLGLKVRRADTTVELPSGGSLVIAGLIEERTKHGMSGIPGIDDLPILGKLFSSRDFRNDETELVVLVTPYLAEATSRSKLALPTDRLAAPSDLDANLFGRINRIYGTGESRPSGSYEGNYGFIVQ